MGDVIAFPRRSIFKHVHGEAPSSLGEIARDLLVHNMGWMYRDEGIPSWISQSWWNFVKAIAAEIGEDNIHWDETYRKFIERWLSHQPEWQRRVNQLTSNTGA